MAVIAIGTTFGEWTVLRKADRVNGNTKWLCRCSCGKEKTVFASSLYGGASTSCGHDQWGRVHLPEYHIWSGIKRRCYNKNERAYKYYGARGISMSDEWRGSFDAFYRDMGPRPNDSFEIERINNDGNYEHGNCRWATAIEQSRNKTTTRRVSFGNLVGAVTEVAEKITGVVSAKNIYQRLDRGWTDEEALTIPEGSRRDPGARHYKRMLTFGGRTLAMTQWAAECGLPIRVLSGRLANGWALDQALGIPLGGKRPDIDHSRSTYITLDGKRMCLSEWAAYTGVSRGKLYRLFKKNLDQTNDKTESLRAVLEELR